MYLQFPMEEKKKINKLKAYLPHDSPSHGKINLTSLGLERSGVFIDLDFHCCDYGAVLIL